MKGQHVLGLRSLIGNELATVTGGGLGRGISHGQPQPLHGVPDVFHGVPEPTIPRFFWWKRWGWVGHGDPLPWLPGGRP